MIEQIRETAARSLAAQTDALIRERITERIGEEWTLHDLSETGRLKVTPGRMECIQLFWTGIPSCS